MLNTYFELEKRINELFLELETASKSYQSLTKLSCISYCGKCCNSPEVEASPLEMLPLALHLWRQGLALEWLTKLEASSANSCIFYEKQSSDGVYGKCSVYPFRPLLCRSFGVSGYVDKHGQKALSVCREIKNDKKEIWQAVQNNEQLIGQAPVAAKWTRQLANLGSTLSNKPSPINEAITIALQQVLNAAYFEGQKEN